MLLFVVINDDVSQNIKLFICIPELQYILSVGFFITPCPSYMSHLGKFISYVSTMCIQIQVPVDLVVDHSVQVDVARSENAVQANMELEFQRNKERFAFLKWGSSAFHNMLVVPPGSGIVHQVRNLA